MTRPKKVTFGAAEWSVLFPRDLGDLAGQTDRLSQRVMVATGEASPLAQRSTLVHELVHRSPRLGWDSWGLGYEIGASA